MQQSKRLLRGVMAMAIAAGTAGAVAPAGATSLMRASLDDLIAGNGTIVVGEVLDAHSYWNDEKSFILTDVRVAVDDVLKGDVTSGSELTVTLMGGSVGDITTLIICGAELVPGSSYVLFLNQEDLPGVKGALTVRDHVQGAFDVVMAKDGLRARSQANGHPLVPDVFGYVDAPGGVEGMPLAAMMSSIRETAGRARIQER